MHSVIYEMTTHDKRFFTSILKAIKLPDFGLNTLNRAVNILTELLGRMLHFLFDLI